jgi:hypothetical protein
MSAPCIYEIRVQGRLGSHWSPWFEGFAVLHEGSDQTVLIGTMDQAALHGLLAKIRDLGLPLVSVKRRTENPQQSQQT